MGSTTEISQNWNLGDEEEADAFSMATSLFVDSVKFEVLKSVIDLDVLEIIKKHGPRVHLSPAAIAAELPTNNPKAAAATLGRLFDFLVTHSILTVSLFTLPDGRVERRYGLAPVCKYLISNEDGISLSPFSYTLMRNALKESCLCLKEAVLESKESFTEAHGMTMYQYIGEHPKFRNEFHGLMSSHSILAMQKILGVYKGFEGLSTLIDVGGGNGTSLNMILTQHPTIKGINFDQPHVIAHAPNHPGVEHVGGDIFVDIPKGDAIFLKWILHCFDDEKCVSILKNCYNALPENQGKVIICEYLLPDVHDTSSNITTNAVVQFDLLMMCMPGGKERTKDEFEALAFAAGFRAFEVVCSAYNIKIMELLK